MWGPDPASLLPKAREIEEARGPADQAVRENYKALAHKVGPQAMRPVVAEQAAFSADRETLCRSYRREGAHGFCNARFTEGRAVVLAARLGILPTPEAAPQAAQPVRAAAPSGAAAAAAAAVSRGADGEPARRVPLSRLPGARLKRQAVPPPSRGSPACGSGPNGSR